MKYKAGQKVLIKKDGLNKEMDQIASSLYPPYVATVKCIDYINPKPHSGKDVYIFEECRYGWYEHEIECLYVPKSKNYFHFIDLD